MTAAHLRTSVLDISWSLVLSASTCAVALLALSKILYRLYFHPLAKHPGPFLARCTSWYAAYQSYSGNIHLDILRCHEIYGDVVRYRPDGLLVNTVEGLHDIYMSPSKTQKSRGYLGFRDGKTDISIINALNREEHAPRRKLLSRAFSTAALKKYEPVIFRTAKVFCETLLGKPSAGEKEKSWGPALDIGHLSAYFTFDIMSNIVFYSPQNLMTETHGRSIIKGIDSTMLMAGVEVQQPRVVDHRKLRNLIFPGVNKRIQGLRKQVWELVMGRVALDKEQHVEDIFGDLLGQEVGKEGHALSNEELMADALVMVIAGTDTSSVAISGFFFFIARHPAVYERLAKEIRSTFSNVEEIAPGEKLSSCAYLLACIDESLRLAPPVASPLWREMRLHDKIAGNVVPKGMDVGTCIYSVQRNPVYFPNPDEFTPERWLPDGQDEAQLTLAKRAFVPFSLGSRGCIGKNIAYMELLTALAQVMYRSDWKSVDGTLGRVGETRVGDKGVVNFALKGHFTSGKEGPYIQFVPRAMREEETL